MTILTFILCRLQVLTDACNDTLCLAEARKQQEPVDDFIQHFAALAYYKREMGMPVCYPATVVQWRTAGPWRALIADVYMRAVVQRDSSWPICYEGWQPPVMSPLMQPMLSNADCLDRAMQTCSGQLAGGGGMDGHYGSLTGNCMRQVLEVMHQCNPFTCSSTLLDAGAGIGRCVAH